MRLRVAVAVDDDDFSYRLVDKLREIGYLVVEPEVADYALIQIGGRLPGVRVSSMSRGSDNDAGLSQFLPLPMTTDDVLAALLSMLVARKRPSPGARRM